MNAMADKSMTETDIHEMELRMEREQQELAARHAAERAKIEEALKASAGEAFGRILATMEKFKDHFSAVQKRKISGFFGEEQTASPKPARAPRKAAKSARVPRYMLPDGDSSRLIAFPNLLASNHKKAIEINGFFAVISE